MTINKDRRYFFDLNNFDAPQVDENAPPPPPVFSLDELGFARDDAFEKGRQQGLAEAQQSREQYIIGQLDNLAKEIKFLLGAESYRAAIYEREVLSLTETILQVLFPYLTETHGLDELKTMIAKVVSNQPEVPKIRIEVPQDDAAEIEAYLRRNPDLDISKLEIAGNPDLGKASCRLAWKDGNALRDHQGLANKIYKMLRAPVEISKDGPLAPDAEKDDNVFDSEGETDHG